MKKLLIALMTVILFCGVLSAAELKVGTAKVNITPDKSVPLWGQFGLRLSQGVKSPIFANVCAVEAIEEGKGIDSVVFVSIDAVGVPTEFTQKIREKAAAKDPSVTAEKIVFFATHTHTAPTFYIGPDLPKGDNIEDYATTIDIISTKIADAICVAWGARVPADFSWGIEQTVIGQSRRACYFDGHAQMYGNPNDPNFSHYENPTDPDLGTLFFWNKEGKLLSVLVNVPCPSQVVEGLSVLCADHWDVTRAKLYERFGQELVVIGCNASAGDDSPHPQYRKEALARMRALRGNLSEMDEIARRIDRAVADSYECAVQDKQSNIAFAHQIETLQLPMRQVTEDEFKNAKAQCDSFKQALVDNPNKSPAEVAFMAIGWYGNVVERYESQQAGNDDKFATTVHVVRLGDVAVATDPFELFADYGMRIKVRSPAVATFIIDLADGAPVGSYLPTEKAIKGGGYSAVIESDPVSAEGGQVLVNETLRMIGEVWK